MQPIAWENSWSILFYSYTVYQEPNQHNLMKDFQDEVAGYVNNQEISDILGCLKLASGLNNIADNMMICY